MTRKHFSKRLAIQAGVHPQSVSHAVVDHLEPIKIHKETANIWSLWRFVYLTSDLPGNKQRRWVSPSVGRRLFLGYVGL